MNKLLMLLAIPITCSCGSVDEYENSDLAELELPYTAPVTTNIQHGSRTTASPIRNRFCDRGTVTQHCSIPSSKLIGYALNANLQDLFNNLLPALNAATALDNATNYTFQPKAFGDPLGIGETRISFTAGPVSGGLAFNIDNAVSVSFGGLTQLTEGVAGTDPVGTYQRHNFCDVTIDNAEMSVIIPESKRVRTFTHAFGHAMAICMGVGGRNDAAADLSYSSTVVTAADKTGLTAGEQCRASGYNPTNNGDFSITGGVGGSCPTVD